MDIDKRAKERIDDLEQQVNDCHIVIDLKDEEIADLKGQLNLAKVGLQHARNAMKVEVA